ncbi:MAG: glycosyltransferase family 8 protein [Elusimicrobiota bacterium]|jgi:lipopolysaccharide biosynthesis glycosyltransferase|nr:glycosyltransferase family 8 protein [Elusimicrobiota bacterium]
MINIVFELDDKFARHCAAVIVSVMKNHTIASAEDRIHFFLLCNLTEENREKLLSLKQTWDFEISFINVDETLFAKLPLDNNSPTLYYRLLIPEILPENVEKIIHLDSDLILNADIKRLWDIKLDGYLIAAVLDEPKINRKKTYINAGVVVYNIKALKEFGFCKKWRDYADVLPQGVKLQYYDQDILNYIIDERVLFLEPNWNVEKYNLSLLTGGNLENLGTLIYSLNIIHYTTQSKPWLPFSEHPLKHLYIKCAKLTPWGNQAGEHSFFERMVYLSKLLLKFWIVHPLFFFKAKFWARVKEYGFVETII